MAIIAITLTQDIVLQMWDLTAITINLLNNMVYIAGQMMAWTAHKMDYLNATKF